MKGKILAIIPARGGSKEIPGKNIKELNGKPLMAYTIEEALKCPEIDRHLIILARGFLFLRCSDYKGGEEHE